VAVITGGPGVGKTTLLDAILRVVAAKDAKILRAAPTGRAAHDRTDRPEATTIHRPLKSIRDGRLPPQRRRAAQMRSLVIDETSMLDVLLMNALLKAVPWHAALLLVGDVDQLPSVGPGRVLADIIESQAVAVARLTEVFRQAAESRIVVNAHRINQGEMPEWPKPGETSDFYFVEAKDRR
jgi:exodeoxyribonuclease V alpha subunit